MAKYNEILSGRFNRALQKMFAMKGEVPSPQLGGEVMPAICFEDMESVELRPLNGWFRYNYGIVCNASAGVKSGVRWRNPTGSNVIVVVEYVDIITGAADSVYVRLTAQNTDLTTAGFTMGGSLQSVLDARASVMIGSAQTSPPASAGVIRQPAIGATSSFTNLVMDANQEICLWPGMTLQFDTAGVNESLTVFVLHRERLLEEMERTV